MSGEIGIKVKMSSDVTKEGPIKQVIMIENIAFDSLKDRALYCSLDLTCKSEKETLEVSLLFRKSFLSNRINRNNQFLTVTFNNTDFSIKLERIYAVKKVAKKEDHYLIKYEMNYAENITIIVNHSFEKGYYEKSILPKIKQVQQKKRQKVPIQKQESNVSNSSKKDVCIGAVSAAPQTVRLPKRVPIQSNQNKKLKRESVGELQKYDLMQADQFTYSYSPNADSNRSKREVLGGSGSNMFRRRR